MNGIKPLSVFAVILTVITCLYSTPVMADTYAGLDELRCMADEWEYRTGKNLPHDIINCTANDVEITQVIPLDENGLRPGEAGYIPVECSPGEIITYDGVRPLEVDMTVRTNANERYDTTFFLPLTEESPQVIQTDGSPEDNCSMLLPVPPGTPGYIDEGAPANANIDGDSCSDITKAFGPDEYVLYNEPIYMICKESPDASNQAEFTYCAAWSVDDDGTDCNAPIGSESAPYGQIPSQKSKCKCDSFPIDVFIKPDPPTILKTLVGTGTHTEFGGEYIFELSFTNPSESAALYIQELTDEVDIEGNGDWDVTLDLLDPSAVETPPAAPAQDGVDDGVYLTDNSDCIAKYEATLIPGEVLSQAEFKCQFKEYIIDTALPGYQAPEFYDDAIKVLLWDKNDDPVVDGTSCSDIGIIPADGEHCSNEVSVNVTNLDPGISVGKEAVGQLSGTNSITEPGETVDFTVTVNNPKTVERLMLTYLHDLTWDGIDLDLNGLGDCATGGWIAPGDTYSCTFPLFVAGNAADGSRSDTVTATLADNEGNTATDNATATLTITDTPSVIVLDKVARESDDPSSTIVTQLDEPGDWVYYHFTVTNTSSVDTVYIDSLTDEINYSGIDVDLTVDPDGAAGDGYTTCNVDPAVMLLPGESYHCVYYTEVMGNAGYHRYNLATASGLDDDGQPVSDDDDHEITILNVNPEARLTKDVKQMLVTYQVEVFNDSAVEELFIDVLNDDKFGDITSLHDNITRTTCELSPDHNAGSGIAIGGSYPCEFDALVTTSPHTDTVTGTVADDDGYNVYPSDSAIVTFGKP